MVHLLTRFRRLAHTSIALTPAHKEGRAVEGLLSQRFLSPALHRPACKYLLQQKRRWPPTSIGSDMVLNTKGQPHINLSKNCCSSSLVMEVLTHTLWTSLVDNLLHPQWMFVYRLILLGTAPSTPAAVGKLEHQTSPLARFGNRTSKPPPICPKAQQSGLMLDKK